MKKIIVSLMLLGSGIIYSSATEKVRKTAILNLVYRDSLCSQLCQNSEEVEKIDILRDVYINFLAKAESLDDVVRMSALMKKRYNTQEQILSKSIEQQASDR